MSDPVPFEVSLEAYGAVPVVVVSGELDLATTPPLERALLRAVEASAHPVVDLSKCTYIDPAGIGAIIRAQRLLRSRIGANPDLRLVVRDPHVIRTLERTGVDEVVTKLWTRLDDALAVDGGPPAMNLD